jgi:ESCRT-II complex subunit VPS25
MAGKEAFVWPKHYSFPPFFARQPNAETNAMRVQMWKDLILNYCRHHRIFVLNVREAVASSPLFGNDAIARRLQPADANEILHLMASSGLAEWFHADGNRLMIFWRKPSEWASTLYEWVEGMGQVDSVLTLYEIREGDMTIGTGMQLSGFRI